MIQYRQGVQFQFRSTGRLYAFDIQTFLGVIVSAIVLFKVAGTITDYVAFYLICCGGQSAMLRRIRAGNVSKDEEVARVGMRAALAATQFRHFDANNDGRLTTEDLVRVFAMVDGVTLEKAHAIARRVLDHAEKKGDEGLTYKDFVTSSRRTSRAPLRHSKALRPVDGSGLKRWHRRRVGLVERCRQAYDDVKGGMMPVIEAQKADGTTPRAARGVGGTREPRRSRRRRAAPPPRPAPAIRADDAALPRAPLGRASAEHVRCIAARVGSSLRQRRGGGCPAGTAPFAWRAARWTPSLTPHLRVETGARAGRPRPSGRFPPPPARRTQAGSAEGDNRMRVRA